MREVRIGKYRHFKGNVYRVLFIGYDAEHDKDGETEKLVKNLGKSNKKKTPKNNSSLEAVYSDVAEKCKQALGTKVEISSKGEGAGKIEIEFYNNDDLEKIIARICQE